MKLYYAPGACSLGIHLLLEEIGAPYETARLDLKAGDQMKPEFLAPNPKGKVPTLVRDDGGVVTEFGAIATWLGTRFPQAGLLPTDPDAEARVVEVVDYVVGTVHGQGFARLLRPAMFAPSVADADRIRDAGREIYAKGLEILERAVAGREFVADRFSVADAALFYVLRWSKAIKTELSAGLAAHLARVSDRPAAKRALAAEGLA